MIKIEPDAFWVDVRTPEEFDEDHAQGSVNIPLDLLIEHLVQFEGKSQVVVFCKSGVRSEHAKEILLHFGFENVVNCGSWQNAASYLKK